MRKELAMRRWLFIFLVLLLAACQQVHPPVTPPAEEPLEELDPAAFQNWSTPSSWPSGKVPVAGEAVFIPKGTNILLDISPPNLKSLQIDGALAFARKDVNLSAGYIIVHGLLRIGSPTVAFASKATITLNATNMNEDIMGMGTKGILVMGGRLELFGATPSVTWTKINATAATGARTLTLKDSVSWKANDKVVVAPTDFFPHDSNNNPDPTYPATELMTVASASGASLNLTTGLKKSRWGVLQYVTSSGMTTTPTTAVSSLVLDERAAVGNLSRNIVIQGADDSLWKNNGFGAHIMVMGSGGRLVVNGVEFRQMGQLGKARRYPIHWHMLSYNESTGVELGDATGQFVRNSSIWNSKNRCVVIHGTNGVTFANNICYDITGHAVFLEDAVERRNIIENNLVLKVRSPNDASRFLAHDSDASGFWLTNPDNTVRGNIAADATKGFWLAFPRQTLGLSTRVTFRPDRLSFGVFTDNVAHSSLEGIHIDDAPKRANPGELESLKYIPMLGTYDKTVETDYDFSKWLRFKLERVTIFKNGTNWGSGPFWNRVSWPDYVNWVSADNTAAFFAGAGDNGLITNSLIIGQSLNKTSSPNKTTPLVALASYHSTFDMTNNIIVNFPFVAKYPGSGAFKTDDYYIRAIDKGLVRNPNNRLINSSPGYRVPPPNMRSDTNPNGRDNWTLAGALWDPHGYWGAKGNFWVYDVPFLTSGASCTQVQPAGQNGMSCSGQYYAVGDYLTDFDTRRYSFAAAIEVSRRNPSSVTQEIGKWTVADGNVSNFFGNMRHFAARPGGYYVLRFPGNALPKRFEASISNAYRATDWFMLGVSFDGSVTPSQVTLSASNSRTLSAASTLAEVASAPGSKFWQDKSQNLLWVKVQGGLIHDPATPNSDQDLYRDMRLEIKSP
jgi:G8 domain/Right handed beta helix region